MHKLKFFLVIGLTFLVSGACSEEEGSSGGDDPGKSAVVGALANVRSCELLLKNTDAAKLDRVVFSEAVEGFSKKRGDFTAIAFVAKADVGLSVDAVQIHMTSGEATALEVDTAKSKCFDGEGAEMADVLWQI